jgi:hypothetical protein
MQQLVFDHIGLRAFEPMPGENWIEQSRCWVTSPREHPESIEFLRYAPDSMVPDRVKDNMHVAFRVDDIGPWIKDEEILIPPFVVAGFVEAVFIWKHNAVFEYMRYLKDGWFEK